MTCKCYVAETQRRFTDINTSQRTMVNLNSNRNNSLYWPFWGTACMYRHVPVRPTLCWSWPGFSTRPIIGTFDLPHWVVKPTRLSKLEHCVGLYRELSLGDFLRWKLYLPQIKNKMVSLWIIHSTLLYIYWK